MSLKTRNAGRGGKRYTQDQSGLVTIVPPEKLLERLPSAHSKKAALDDIHRKLAAATILAIEHGDGGRAAVQLAMQDLIDYFSNLGVPMAALKPLEIVRDAIIDAEKGHVSPVFHPKRKPQGGRPPKSEAKLEFHGLLAAITELCIMHFQRQGHRAYLIDGCQEAAKLINGAGKHGRVTADQLRKLREKVGEATSGSLDRSLRDALLDSETINSHPLDAAKLYALNEMVQSLPKKKS